MSDAILDKVRKLLAKAENPACTEAEARAFTDKAAELIAKYGVDTALLSAADPTVDPVGDLVLDVPAPYALDKCGLLAGVADVLRCRSVRRQRWDGERKAFAMHLFGHESDLRRVELLFTSLLVQAGYAMVGQHVPADESVAAYRRSWLAGFTRAIVGRLRAAEERAAAAVSTDDTHGGPSLAVVLAHRGAEVAQRMADAYPRLRSAGPRRLAGSGMPHGYEAGQRADLGGARVTPRSGAPALDA